MANSSFGNHGDTEKSSTGMGDCVMSGENIGTVYAVGFGPGDECYETIEAREVLAGVDVIVGYQTYVKLLEAQFPEKRFLVSGMHAEEARCREALRLASEGQNVAVVSSGDSAVYGMAGLLYTLSEEDAYRGVQVVTVPGLSAVLSGSAVLGAPVGHDFCVISPRRTEEPDLPAERARRARDGESGSAAGNRYAEYDFHREQRNARHRDAGWPADGDSPRV